MKTVLVTGGAGYIGSHMVRFLVENGFHCVVIDDLSTGHADAVHPSAIFFHGEISNKILLDFILKHYNFDCVFHFASSIQVGESMIHPSKYYLNNVANSIIFFDALIKANINKCIFSSTAAVYGFNDGEKFTENHKKSPVSTYGKTKLIIENLLQDYHSSYKINSVSLRYFNASGASPDRCLGERHSPETHLIPLAIETAQGKRPYLEIYGNNYSTKDGTCIRDYVHVCDLVDAHFLAYQWLNNNENGIQQFNLGTGVGYSVSDVIQTVERISGNSIPFRFLPKRVGDPAILVADASLAAQHLGWKPKFADLGLIVQHAWDFANRESDTHW